MSDSPTANIQSIAERIRGELALKHQAREAAYPLTRQVVRNSANAIRAVHRGEFETAQKLLSTAGGLLSEITAAIVDHPELRYTGYVETAEKEFTEASITLSLVSGKAIPGPDALGVVNSAYLNGLAEAASEMRRELLDHLRRGLIGRCEEILKSMDDIYDVLVTIDFPDALTGNLRRTTDMLRGVLERTRGDLTMAIAQSRLEEKLTRVEEGLSGRG
jgi:translin